MKKPLSIQRLNLSFKAVLIRCLDKNHQPITNAHASGFIRRESENLYLYTCWHVVTGYDRNDLKVKNELPNRAFLEIDMQDAQVRQPGITAIGGLQSLIIPLYDETYSPKLPLWYQDDRHIPHPDLNLINIFVPFWHDVVKIALPADVRTSDIQVVEESFLNTLLTPGDKLYVVGFPYGFSSAGAKQPTPVVLTRFVASCHIGGRQQEVLLESAGAPGMSGGPVFVEREMDISLLGIYTGLLFPDNVIEKNEKVMALGTCSDLTMCLHGHIPLVLNPSQPHEGTSK
jgi:hypothetical protein